MEFRAVPTGKLRRYFSPANFFDLFKIPLGILKSLWHILIFKPDVIFSKGGYVAVPVVIAGGILRTKIVIHESDFTPGFATKISAYFASKICVAHIKTKEKFSKKIQKKVKVTGNPVRVDILKGSKQNALKFLKIKTVKNPVLLIMGGSTGAQSVNKFVWENLNVILKKHSVIHVTGGGKGRKMSRKNYFQFEYLNKELKDIYALTDVVIGRAGAGTVSEINVLGLPAVYFPLGSDASRGDQWENAKYMSATPNIILDEKNTNAKILLDSIDFLWRQSGKRKTRAQSASPQSLIVDELI